MSRNFDKTFKETNFSQIINIIWKKKLFIFLTTFTFSLLAYFWSLNYTYTKIYSTKITLNKPPLYLFTNYDKLDYVLRHDLRNIFRSTIKKNFLDINNLQNFINQSKEYDSLKNFLISKNTTASMYFENNLLVKIDLSDQDILIINHPNKINGDFFIKSYLEYIKNISVDEIKKILKFYLEFEINEKKNNLDYIQNTEHINWLKFLKKNESKIESNYKFTKEFELTLNEDRLNRELTNLISLNNKLQNESFDYQIIKIISSDQKINDKASIHFILTGLIFGLFLSLVFVFLRN